MAQTQINLRLADDELAAVDSVRGLVPRNAWIRQLVRDACVAAGALRNAGPVVEEAAKRNQTVAAVTTPAPSRARPMMMRRSPELIAQETGHHVGCGCAKCDALMFV